METVEVVIRIPKQDYNVFKHGRMPNDAREFTKYMVNAIAKGTVLPKKHGRLIDADDYLANTPIRKSADEVWIKETYVYDTIMDAPTVIEANRGGERMALRTKSEQKAYLDGFERCAECIEKYLSDEGKEQLKCLLTAVRNAVEIEDIAQSEYEHDHEVVKAYNDGQTDILDKIRAEIEDIPNNPATKPVGTYDYCVGARNERRIILEIINKHRGE